MDSGVLLAFPWEKLHLWYKKNGNHTLPWRDYSIGKKNKGELLYRIWLSEILLQQTQVDRVIPYMERILEIFPTIHSLAGTDYETFFPYYQGMGYYSRARNILKTAKIVCEKYGGVFPSLMGELVKLPGVGVYTASAIQAFGYGLPVLAWDTNLEKVFARYYSGRKDIKLTEVEQEILREDFRNFVEKEKNEEMREILVRNINNALMDFSRLIDHKNPQLIDWENYIFTESKFFETRGKLEPVLEKKSVRFPTADAHVVVIIHESHKIYYSKEREKYIPYILPAVGENNTRAYVQCYFRESLGIELSVRPVHKKWMGEDGIAYIAVYAQIQAGKLHAKIYNKDNILEELTLYKK